MFYKISIMKQYFLFFFILFSIPISLIAQHEPNFVEATDEEHYMVFLPTPDWADIREMTTSIAKFNAKNYAAKQLITKRFKMYPDDPMPFFLVKEFSDEAAAKAYYEKVTKPKADFLQMGITKDWFYISKSNYNEVLRAKSFTQYSAYFKKEKS